MVSGRPGVGWLGGGCDQNKDIGIMARPRVILTVAQAQNRLEKTGIHSQSFPLNRHK